MDWRKVADSSKGYSKADVRLNIWHSLWEWQRRSDAGLRPTAPCGRHPVWQQEVHEYETFGDSLPGCLYCRLTSFCQSLQINLRIILDSTVWR